MALINPPPDINNEILKLDIDQWKTLRSSRSQSKGDSSEQNCETSKPPKVCKNKIILVS